MEMNFDYTSGNNGNISGSCEGAPDGVTKSTVVFTYSDRETPGKQKQHNKFCWF
mgnify:CR=1 FL=1